jgi:hypothetical protein
MPILDDIARLNALRDERYAVMLFINERCRFQEYGGNRVLRPVL